MFSNGIIVLTILSVALIAVVGANVNALVPFYAIGVFTAFSMAGFGMARYHTRHKEPGWRHKRVINFSAGVMTSIVVVIFAVVKFTEGAWLILIIFPLLVILLIRLNREYRAESRALQNILQERQAVRDGKAPAPLTPVPGPPQDGEQQDGEQRHLKAAVAAATPADVKPEPLPGAGGYDRPIPPPGVPPIGALTLPGHQPGKVTVEGRVRVVEIKPVERNSVLACEICDSTGDLTALFYGRSRIAGLICGSRVRFRGPVGIKGGTPLMVNPAYELIVPPVGSGSGYND